MTTITLYRTTRVKQKPQFGIIYVNDTPICLSLERPWLDNLPRISCIPVGTYECKIRTSSKTDGAPTLEVLGVPNRVGVLFHWGNTIGDSEGCILTGSKIGAVSGEIGVLSSRIAWAKLMEAIPREGAITLSIIDIAEPP